MKRILLGLLAVFLAAPVTAQEKPLRWIPYPFPPDVTTSYVRPPSLTRELEVRRSGEEDRIFTYDQDDYPDISVGGLKLRPDGTVCLSAEDRRGKCALYARQDGVRYRIGDFDTRLPVRIEFGLKK